MEQTVYAANKKHRSAVLFTSALVLFAVVLLGLPVMRIYGATGESEADVLKRCVGKSAYVYDQELALISAKLSQAAEEGDNGKSDSEIRSYLKTLGFKSSDITSKNYNGTLAYTLARKNIGNKTKLLIITARGQVDAYGYYKDFSTSAKTKYQGYKVYDIVRDYHSAIRKGLDKFMTDGQKYVILVTGHGLGGAAANRVAAELNNTCKDKEDIFCYTFGAIDSIQTSGSTVKTGYENIHNIYNDKDTFAPKQVGNDLVSAAGSIYGKFGHVISFSKDYRTSSQKEQSTTRQCKAAVNHKMANYVKAVKSGLVKSPEAKVKFYNDDSLVKTKTITYGKQYGTLPAPTRSGYKLVGWYTRKSGGTKVTSASLCFKTGTVKLYARWESTSKLVKLLSGYGEDGYGTKSYTAYDCNGDGKTDTLKIKRFESGTSYPDTYSNIEIYINGKLKHSLMREINAGGYGNLYYFCTGKSEEYLLVEVCYRGGATEYEALYLSDGSFDSCTLGSWYQISKIARSGSKLKLTVFPEKYAYGSAYLGETSVTLTLSLKKGAVSYTTGTLTVSGTRNFRAASGFYLMESAGGTTDNGVYVAAGKTVTIKQGYLKKDGSVCFKVSVDGRTGWLGSGADLEDR